MPATSPSATQRIAESISQAFVERRLMPGTKLAEQQIADIFKVSRTLVRQPPTCRFPSCPPREARELGSGPSFS